MASKWASIEFNEKVIVVRSNESVEMSQLRTWVKYVIFDCFNNFIHYVVKLRRKIPLCMMVMVENNQKFTLRVN